MSPSEIEKMSDDDEEAEMSMDEFSGVGQCVADKMGLEVDCLSNTKDGTTRLLPLGDYILIFTTVIQSNSIITQVAAAVLVEGFVEKNGVDWIVKNGVAGFGCEHILHSVGSIVKFVLDELRNRVWDAWLTDTGRRLHIRLRKVVRVLSWDLISTDVRAYNLDADRATLLASEKKRIMTSTVSTDLNVIEKTEFADIAVEETDANDTY